MIQAQELIKKFSDILEVWHGESPARLERASAAESCQPGDLVFATKQDQFDQAINQKASVIIASDKLRLPPSAPGTTQVLKTTNTSLAMAKILPLFDIKQKKWAFTGIHKLANIHPTATIAKDATIEAFVTIGENVKIGARSFIGSSSVLEANVVIGEDCKIHPLVFVGSECLLGNHCEVHPHVTIGCDGFGYAQDRDFHHHKLPQLGRVRIGDHVEIGSGTIIDRAAFTETVIGSGTKLDNLCHIAHNCEIGENSIIAGGFMIAGSSKIGKRFMTGGSTVVADHVSITDGVILAGRSTVTNDIEKSGAYGGYPVVPMKEHLKTIASLPHLVRLRKQVSRILKHLNIEESL